MARGMGFEVSEITDISALEIALGASIGASGIAVVRVRVPHRRTNVAAHEAAMASVDSALQRLRPN